MRFFLWVFLLFSVCCLPAKSAISEPPAHKYTDHPKDPDANTLIIPTWVDDSFSPDLKGAVANALVEWNAVLNGKMRFEPRNDKDWKERLERGEFSLYVHKIPVAEVPMQGILGWWSPFEPMTINVVDGVLNLPPSGMSTVVMHEIGHYLGLDHVHVKGTLMFPGWTAQGECIDHVTVAKLAMERNWTDRYLNYCVR